MLEAVGGSAISRAVCLRLRTALAVELFCFRSHKTFSLRLSDNSEASIILVVVLGERGEELSFEGALTIGAGFVMLVFSVENVASSSYDDPLERSLWLDPCRVGVGLEALCSNAAVRSFWRIVSVRRDCCETGSGLGSTLWNRSSSVEDSVVSDMEPSQSDPSSSSTSLSSSMAHSEILSLD